MIELITGPDDNGRRLDRILRKALPDHSLSLIHRLLRQGKVLVNGKPASQSERVEPGQTIQLVSQLTTNSVNVNKKTLYPPPPLPEILWQGSGIIVFNKPAGLATHGSNSLETLVNEHLTATLPPSLSFKPGPLHRLDKPTSGVIAFSQSIEGARFFSRLLQERKIEKTYLAIIEGTFSGEQTWEDELVRDTTAKKTYVNPHGAQNVSGKQHMPELQNALASVKALASNGRYSLIEVKLVTGRTHQIRAQAAAHGHPLAGDTKYGGGRWPAGTGNEGRFFLHAWTLSLAENHDCGFDFPQCITAPLPQLFRTKIRGLFHENF